MKYSEFLVDFTSALKNKNKVAVLELVTNQPFYSRTSMNDPKMRMLYVDFLKGDRFVKTVLTAGEADPLEGTSVPAHAVRSIIGNREFHIYSSKKMHRIADFVDTKKGMMQVKNYNQYRDSTFIKQLDHNALCVHEVEIYTNANKLTLTTEVVRNPTFKITTYEDLEKLSGDKIDEMLTNFYKNEAEYLNIKNTKVIPLMERHANFVRSFPKAPYDIVMHSNPHFNLEALANEEQCELLKELKKIKNITF